MAVTEDNMNLRYDLMTAHLDCGEGRHAQEVMERLGITYQHATQQSLFDQWWFWNCENIPASLPDFLTELDINPMDVIGNGLSKETATALQHQKS